MSATRTYNYQLKRIRAASIWIGVAITCIIAIVTLYNQAQLRAKALDSLTSASNAIIRPAPQTQPSAPSCYSGGVPIYDPVKCVVPTATSN